MQEYWRKQIKNEVKKGMMALKQKAPLTESKALQLLLNPLREIEILRQGYCLNESEDQLCVRRWQVALIKAAAVNAVSDAEKDKIIAWTFPYQVRVDHWKMQMIREKVSSCI